MKQITIEPIDTTKAEDASKQAVITLTEARSLKIMSQEGYDKAGGVLQAIKGRIKLLDTLRKSITKPLDEAKAKVMELFRPAVQYYEEAEITIKIGMLTYSEEQERLRRIEQERLERIAEQERQKKAAQEEAWRRKEEEKRKEAERLAQEAAKIKNAKARAEAEAAAAKAQAEADKAQAKADERAFEQQNIVTPIAAPKVEQPNGFYYKDQWYAEVVNFALLSDDFKLPDMQKLDKTAMATKGTLNVPGVVFKSRKIPVSKIAK